jgi:hypothetical protein
MGCTQNLNVRQMYSTYRLLTCTFYKSLKTVNYPSVNRQTHQAFLLILQRAMQEVISCNT